MAEATCFKVEQGASLSQVSRALESEGVVSDARIFRIGADYSNRSAALKFGSYLLSPQASMSDVLQVLTAGGISTCWRTTPITSIIHRLSRGCAQTARSIRAPGFSRLRR